MPIVLPEDPLERKRVKAQAWRDGLVALHYPINFTQDGISITVHDGEADLRNGIWFVWVVVSTAAGTGLDHHRIEVVNPPLKVPDGSGGYVENVVQAAKMVLAQTVKSLVGL